MPQNPTSGNSPLANYPARPPFFANDFIRLMADSCLANEIGADACFLLTLVVMTEDRTRYTKAVTFFNSQLTRLMGYSDEDAMADLRKKAVRSGWLSYTPGRKGVPGRYFVEIPPEHADSLPTLSTAERRWKEGGQVRGKRGDKSVESPDHSSLSRPDPEPISATASPPPAGEEKKATKKPKADRPRNPLFDAIAEVCGLDPATAGSLIGKVTATLAAADPPYTTEEVHQFARRLGDYCPWSRKYRRTQPTPGELQKWIGKIRSAPPTPARSRTALYDPVPTASSPGDPARD